MKTVKISDNVYWVGGIDWDLRNFHGYLTQRGSTYNAYLIIDEKITLVDTVKHYCYDEMIKRISEIIDPAKIDYIIANHVEMDHTGALPKIMELTPNAQIITSPQGKKGLIAHYGDTYNYRVVESCETINIGKTDLQFLLTPMVHWPDNMFTYMPKEKLLFSNDAFGQHIASSERFDDEYPIDVIIEEARKYYANIVLPYSKQVQKVLEASSGLDIEIIAPSHGIIWKKHINRIIDEYKKWSSNTVKKNAVIIYDTMWHSTRKMAFTIEEAFEEKGYATSIINLQHHHISDIMTKLIFAEYVCVGSPTLNKNIMPTVAGFLTYLKGLAPKNRKAFAFGSYGWVPNGPTQVKEYLEATSFNVIDTYKIQYIPSGEKLLELKNSVMEKI